MQQQQVPLNWSFLKLVLVITAVVMFVLAAFSGVWTREQLVALGLAFFAAGIAVP